MIIVRYDYLKNFFILMEEILMIRNKLAGPSLILLGFIIHLLCVSAEAGAEILVDDFKNGMRPGWETKIFQKETIYKATVQNSIPCIQASSKGTASGMIYKIEFDPKEHPVLNWQWKVDNIISKGDARTKSGDDYPARIYVVFPSMFFWQTKILNYIWANKLPKGTSVKSSYSTNFAMIAVESGRENLGRWQEYNMNIYKNYIDNFGTAPPDVGAVAIMTDTDNTGETASACYGPIRFLPAD